MYGIVRAVKYGGIYIYNGIEFVKYKLLVETYITAYDANGALYTTLSMMDCDVSYNINKPFTVPEEYDLIAGEECSGSSKLKYSILKPGTNSHDIATALLTRRGEEYRRRVSNYLYHQTGN